METKDCDNQTSSWARTSPYFTGKTIGIRAKNLCTAYQSAVMEAQSNCFPQPFYPPPCSPRPCCVLCTPCASCIPPGRCICPTCSPPCPECCRYPCSCVYCCCMTKTPNNSYNKSKT